jgi:hypothetical protein
MQYNNSKRPDNNFNADPSQEIYPIVHLPNPAIMNLLIHLGKPLSAQPSIKHIQRWLRLVEWHHMSSGVDLDEREVAGALDVSNLVAGISLLEFLELGLCEVLLAGPLESLSPCLVTEPIADDYAAN